MFNLTWMKISSKKIFDEVLLIFPSYKEKKWERVHGRRADKACALIYFSTPVNSFSQSTSFVERCSWSSSQKLFHSQCYFHVTASKMRKYRDNILQTPKALRICASRFSLQMFQDDKPFLAKQTSKEIFRPSFHYAKCAEQLVSWV